LWGWRTWWNEWQGKPKYSEKTCPDATLSTTNPTWPDPGLKPRRRGGKPATNHFSYGAAHLKGFGGGIKELHAKPDADVAQFCHPLQTKRNTKLKKHSRKNNACSQRSVTWHTDAIGLRKCDFGPASHLLSPRQLQK
jgi:hypothetical protein